MAARVHRGETLEAYIYVPGAKRAAGKDVGVREPMLVVARRGEGCFLNGKRISFSRRPTVAAEAYVSFACRAEDRTAHAALCAAMPNALRRFTAAYDYASLLRGDRDAVLFSEGCGLSGEGGCFPWDHAAGVLAIAEAGGHAALPVSESGAPYSPLRRYPRLLVAASHALWTDLYRHMVERAPDLCEAARYAYLKYSTAA